MRFIQDQFSTATPIIFPHLIHLSLVAHVDYTKQFLVHDKCNLPRLLELEIVYGPLLKVTNNFINDATSHTCAYLTNLHINKMFVRPENFNRYLPLLQYDRLFRKLDACKQISI